MKEEKNEKKIKDQKKILKYMSIGLNMMYTLCTPIFLMLALYFFVIEKKFGKQPVILIILIILGIISGYHSFFKLVKSIEK